jgi:pyruvate carboxylase
MDIDTGAFYFIEVNPRIQVEHTVTEEVTGIDIVKAQIHILEGAVIGTPESGVPVQADIRLNGHALQCRITTEDPEQNFIPDYGRITAYRGATGFGIRLDGGTAYSGAVITRFYDPLLEKVTAWAPTPEETIQRMDRALREFRIRGVATNLTFLEAIIGHPEFRNNTYTTRFIDTTPELFEQVKRQDRATKLLTYLADVTVNGHPETKGRPLPAADAAAPRVPHVDMPVVDGTRQRLDALGPKGFADWMRGQKRVLMTDTTMRDGHQSLLATRMRTHDIRRRRCLCAGVASTSVAGMLGRSDLRRVDAVPHRGSVGAARDGAAGGAEPALADAAARRQRRWLQELSRQCGQAFRAAGSAGRDRSVPRVRLPQLGREHARLDGRGVRGEQAVRSNDLLHRRHSQFGPAEIRPEVLHRACRRAGKGRRAYHRGQGHGRAAEARSGPAIVQGAREATDLPIHFHTHDTSGISAATVLAAVDSGVDAVDAAMDALSGNTSQPCLGSIVEALKGHERDPGLDTEWIRRISFYWEAVRNQYAAFESDLKAPASEVYLHEMPGGQFTNLKEQARSLGLETRWHEVARPMPTSTRCSATSSR